MNGKTLLALTLALAGVFAFAQEPRRPNPDAKLHRFSSTIEKERPELGPETQALLAAWRRDPSDANLAALRAQVGRNYDQVVARKKAKLEELKQTARHASQVQEMKEIVDEMVASREHRIDQTLARFTDGRFRPRSREAAADYLPLLGAPGVEIAVVPVTQGDWAAFSGSSAAPGKERHPIVNVNLDGVRNYCAWLEARDPAHRYRLPTEEEWELAAGHMPKDADFNCGVGSVATSVDAYAKTIGACGGYDFWGNCWEWTSTRRGNGERAVKGGAFDSTRADCRTESKAASRDGTRAWPNVTFRLVREIR